MINICVWSDKYIEIESETFSISNREDMLNFIKQLLDKAYYSGERLCLESAEIKDGKNFYSEIERWKKEN